MFTRDQLVTEAKSWIGTKWQHQQSLKGTACDCAGFVRGAYRNLTGMAVECPTNYPSTWHFFKTDPKMLETCLSNMEEIDLKDIAPGDVLVFRFKGMKVDHHMGIYIGGGQFVHAEMEAQMVHISPLDTTWQSRLTHAFKFKELSE